MSDPAPDAADQPARWLPADERRALLVATAIPLVAEDGFSAFSLEQLAEHAHVTRNLLYHYFPRGRRDIVLAVAEEVGRQLTLQQASDASLPLATRIERNFSHFLDHALTPSDVWRVRRQSSSIPYPEVRAIGQAFTDRVVSTISLNHLGTPSPPPLVRTALRGYLAFAETVLDGARETGASRDQLLGLLSSTLVATVAAARAAAEASPSPAEGSTEGSG